MYRTALRTKPATSALRGLGPRCLKNGAAAAGGRRFASTASSPADKPRTWKSSALRWGLAAGAVYYYSTSSVFADEPAAAQTVAAPPSFDDSDLPTVDSVLEEKRKQIHDKLEKPRSQSDTKKVESPSAEQTPSQAQSQAAEEAGAAEGGLGALEEEAGQQAAFNPETGEINWDCPCLGGMAHGPCGEEFKTAFSCFVYSEEEPKGMDCIEKFQAMQGCFRQYPEIYGAELGDEEDDGPATDIEAAAAADATTEPPNGDAQVLREQHSPAVAEQVVDIETKSLPGDTPANGKVPTKWEDATAANGEPKDAQKSPKDIQDEKEKQ